MIQKLSDKAILTLKQYSYLIYLPISLIPWWSMQMGQSTGNYDLFSWFGLFMMLGFFPILDLVLGQESVNPTSEEEKEMDNFYYRITSVMLVPVVYIQIFYCAYVFSSVEFSLVGQMGWLISCGIVIAIQAINAGHELIHKTPRWENISGGLLYAAIFFGGFKVEHVRGHHVNVSTPADASSARFGWSLYRFLPQAILRNAVAGWRLEAKRLRAKGLSPLHWRNELLYWYGISLTILALSYFFFSTAGVIFYLSISAISITTLEIINYVEHYGLHRRKLPNGKYENTTPAHSWNSNYYFSNIGLFQVQRHSDHHAFPMRRYQILRHYDGSPQLPFGYGTMYLIAMVPPLWFHIMNHRVEAYYEGESWQLSRQQFEETLA